MPRSVGRHDVLRRSEGRQQGRHGVRRSGGDWRRSRSRSRGSPPPSYEDSIQDQGGATGQDIKEEIDPRWPPGMPPGPPPGMPPGVMDEAARPVLWDVGSDVGRRHEGRSEIDSSSAGHMMFNLDVLKKMAMLSAAPVIYDLRGAKAGVVNIGVLPTWGTKPRSNMEEEREEGKATKAENPLVYLAVLCCGWGWFLTKVLLNGVWISGDCPLDWEGGGPGEGTAKWGPDLGRLPPPIGRGGAVAKMRWKRALLRGGGPPNRRNAAKKSVFWGQTVESRSGSAGK